MNMCWQEGYWGLISDPYLGGGGEGGRDTLDSEAGPRESAAHPLGSSGAGRTFPSCARVEQGGWAFMPPRWTGHQMQAGPGKGSSIRQEGLFSQGQWQGVGVSAVSRQPSEG